jgi:LmbE family N-acetylglucosaminyl deacetylase
MGSNPLASDGTILIAAHADDAAYSVGGALLKGALPLPVTAVTVFTKTNYAPYLPSSSGLSVEEITRISKEEDKAYFSQLGIDVIHLDFLDAPLRGYNDPGNPLLKDRPGRSILGMERSINDPVFHRVEEKIEQTLSAFSGSHLALPMGLGCHIDHLVTSDACLSANSKLRTIFYEDVPYAFWYPVMRINRIVHSIDPTAKPVYVRIEREMRQKLKNLELYRSQVGPETGKVLSYARRVGRNMGPVERLWFSTKNPSGSKERLRSVRVSRRLHMLDTQYRRIAKELGVWW